MNIWAAKKLVRDLQQVNDKVDLRDSKISIYLAVFIESWDG